MPMMTDTMNQFFQANMLWLLPLIIVDTVLKGIALWRSGRNQHLGWFIALFLINSAGILPAIYLLAVDTKKKKKK